MDARSRAKEVVFILLIISCVMYFYFLAFSNTGEFGKDIKHSSSEYFGFMSYIIPVFLSITSILIYIGWHRKQNYIVISLKIIGIVILFFGLDTLSNQGKLGGFLREMDLFIGSAGSIIV